MLRIIIPLAGKGSRFAEAGYKFPKPLIDMKGKTMIARVIENLKPKNTEEYRFIFLVQKEHLDSYSLMDVFRTELPDHNFDVIPVNGITEGAACTVLLASHLINNEDSLMLANSDQIIEEGEISRWFNHIQVSKEDGCIMTFNANHPKWSYARLNEEGGVCEVAEKRVISDHATTGIYWFKHGEDFVKNALAMIEKDIRTNGEFYVCPVYNEFILNGGNIGIFEIGEEAMRGVGVPEDLESYLSKYL